MDAIFHQIFMGCQREAIGEKCLGVFPVYEFVGAVIACKEFIPDKNIIFRIVHFLSCYLAISDGKYRFA